MTQRATVASHSFYDKITYLAPEKRVVEVNTSVLEDSCIFVLFVHYVTKFGENLQCCVSSQLGDLVQNSREYPMQWTDNHYWRIVLQVHKNRPLYYHFCMKGPNGSVVREAITRILQYSSKDSPKGDIKLIEDVWQRNRHLNFVEPEYHIFMSQKRKQESVSTLSDSELRTRLKEQEQIIENLTKQVRNLREEKTQVKEEKNTIVKQNQDLARELHESKTLIGEMEEKLNFHKGLDLHKMNLNVLEEHDKTIRQYSEAIHQCYISRLKQQTRQNETKLCVCCYDLPVNTFCSPCAHVCMCYECAQQLFYQDDPSCPICRHSIRQIQKIFL